MLYLINIGFLYFCVDEQNRFFLLLIHFSTAPMCLVVSCIALIIFHLSDRFSFLWDLRQFFNGRFMGHEIFRPALLEILIREKFISLNGIFYSDCATKYKVNVQNVISSLSSLRYNKKGKVTKHSLAAPTTFSLRKRCLSTFPGVYVSNHTMIP